MKLNGGSECEIIFAPDEIVTFSSIVINSGLLLSIKTPIPIQTELCFLIFTPLAIHNHLLKGGGEIKDKYPKKSLNNLKIIELEKLIKMI